jgi:hypothetical protein
VLVQDVPHGDLGLALNVCQSVIAEDVLEYRLHGCQVKGMCWVNGCSSRRRLHIWGCNGVLGGGHAVCDRSAGQE